MLDIKITRTTCPKEKPQDESKLGFGKKFTDHMFVMDYTEGEGWHDARIVPYAPFQLDPATVVFHYAQEIFEGMKAYRTADDTIQLFRPECNAKRMQDSADRLCIPKIPVEDYIQAVEALVDVDRDWVPHADGASRSAADRHVRDFAFFFVTLPVLFTFDKKISFPICCSGQPDFKYFHLSIYWKYHDIITFFIYQPFEIYCCLRRKR